MISSARVIVDSKRPEAARVRKAPAIHPFPLIPGACNARCKRCLEFAKSWSQYRTSRVEHEGHFLFPQEGEWEGISFCSTDAAQLIRGYRGAYGIRLG